MDTVERIVLECPRYRQRRPASLKSMNIISRLSLQEEKLLKDIYIYKYKSCMRLKSFYLEE